jgi:hypothetical protein
MPSESPHLEYLMIKRKTIAFKIEELKIKLYRIDNEIEEERLRSQKRTIIKIGEIYIADCYGFQIISFDNPFSNQFLFYSDCPFPEGIDTVFESGAIQDFRILTQDEGPGIEGKCYIRSMKWDKRSEFIISVLKEVKIMNF